WTALAYPAAPVTSVAGKTGVVTLAKSDVGLGNVDNTSDANKPVSTAMQTALNAKANTSSLATVATSGKYTDLTDKPTIPVDTGGVLGGTVPDEEGGGEGAISVGPTAAIADGNGAAISIGDD